MTTKLLHDIGEALYGSRWQSALAEALSVNERTVRRWVAGDTSPSAGVWLDLRRLCREHAAALDDLASSIPK